MNQSRKLAMMMARVTNSRPKVYQRGQMNYYENDLRIRIRNVKLLRDGSHLINLTGYPIILTNHVYYHCVWNNLDMIIHHKSGKKYKTNSEKEQEKIAIAIKYCMDSKRYLTDPDLFSDEEWPRNDLYLANQVLVYDKDNVWKDIGDELNTRYHTDVTRLVIKRNQTYYDLLDARNDKDWEMTLIDSLNSASHTVSFVKREKNEIESEDESH